MAYTWCNSHSQNAYRGVMQMYEPNDIPPIIISPQNDPMSLKAASDYRAERAKKDFQSHSLLGGSVLGVLLWELGYILSLPVRVPVFLWGKLRRKR
jgi:hypothetical protein